MASSPSGIVSGASAFYGCRRPEVITASRASASNRKDRKRRLNERYAEQERQAEERAARQRVLLDAARFADAWTSFSVLLATTIGRHLDRAAERINTAAGNALARRETNQKIENFVNDI